MEEKMKNKIIVCKIFKLLLLILLLLFSIYGSIYIKENNLLYSANEEKQKIANILEITNANTFKPINLKYKSTGIGSKDKIIQIRFIISIKEYNSNNLNYENLNYGEQEIAEMSYKYKTKLSSEYYECIIAESNLVNEELYNKFKGIETRENLKYIMYFITLIILILIVISVKKFIK